MLSIAGSNVSVPLRTLLALVACATVLALPAVAGAAPGSGAVRVTIGGDGETAKAIAAAGVKVGALAPAKRRGSRVTLPVQSLSVGGSAAVVLRGGIRFGAGGRTLKLRALRVKLTSKRATVTAKPGKRRVDVFSAALPKGKARLHRSDMTAKLAGSKLALTRAGARLVRSKLALADLPAGRLGRLAIDARPKGSGGSGGPGGGSGGGGPQAGPLGNEPPILARPVGAVDISSASLTWRPRVSWICYINSGEGTSVFGGAVNGSAESVACDSGPLDLVASFHGFPFASGWYEAATGKAAIYFQGGVGFRYSDHGINFSSSKPEIEINGGASRAIFTFNGTDGSEYDNQRGVLVDLHPSPIQTPPNGTVAYNDVPATIPQDTGASVFAGFYPANTPFGTLTVSFTTP